jgi:hypothetical protein
MERKRYPAAAASSAALGEYISEFVIEVVKLNAAAKNPTNFHQPLSYLMGGHTATRYASIELNPTVRITPNIHAS